MIGRPVSLNDLNNQTSSTIIQLRESLLAVLRLDTWLTDNDDEVLTGLGITDPDDRFLLRAAVQDLAHLARIWEGTDVQADVHDFRTLSQQLTGID